jgi:hypothetical protein
MTKVEELQRPLREAARSAARMFTNARSRLNVLTSEVAHDSQPVARHALRFANVARKQLATLRAVVREEALSIRKQLTTGGSHVGS